MTTNNDLQRLFHDETHVQRWKAESENAGARLELARQQKNMNTLLSRHTPVSYCDIDRDQLRVLFKFVHHGDWDRLMRDLGELT